MPLSDRIYELLLESGDGEFLLEDGSGTIILEEQPESVASGGAGGGRRHYSARATPGLAELIPGRLWVSDGRNLRRKITALGIRTSVNLSSLPDPVVQDVRRVQTIIKYSVPTRTVLNGLVTVIVNALRAGKRVLLHARSNHSAVVLVASLVLRAWFGVSAEEAMRYMRFFVATDQISLPFKRYLEAVA